MRFIYGKQTLSDRKQGEKYCYLLANGLGGYSSLTALGSCSRNEHALFMAAETPPCDRYCLIAEMEEWIYTESREYRLSAQEYADHTKNEDGYLYLDAFIKDEFPHWRYRTSGIEIGKEIVMQNGENELALRYRIVNDTDKPVWFSCIPWMRFAPKGEQPEYGRLFATDQETVKSDGRTLFYQTNGEPVLWEEAAWKEDCYYRYDARDGRRAVGRMAATHAIDLKVPARSENTLYILYSFGFKEYAKNIAVYVDDLFTAEKTRLESLRIRSGFTSEMACQLVDSADAYIVARESTGQKTIIAGYPFFGDWGRDTMLSINGICMETARLEEARSMFRSFMEYCRNGIMPNMFPEKEQEPIYNTVDASLLFIQAVYEYYLKSRDVSFIREAWETMTEIISWYRKGTDYHIHMDEDGLLCAGAELEQVTWMDVQIQGELPTPRQGKAVEINVWWYNALCMMGEFAKILNVDGELYRETAELVKKNFEQVFWNEKENCLKDTASNDHGDEQIRCNQIWAVSAPFSLLPEEKELAVVEKVYRELYTGCGLRTLSAKDPEFHCVYEGSMYDRDMAYHQGTVWMFPLGAYYLAYLKVNRYSTEAKKRVESQLDCLYDCLREGCAGQLPEIYDGGNPSQSRGCFAQAWSVGELLRVFRKLEEVQE